MGKGKRNLIISIAASLLATFSLSVATYAWFLTSLKANPEQLILNSGVSSVYVDMMGYACSLRGNPSSSTSGQISAPNRLSIDRSGDIEVYGGTQSTSTATVHASFLTQIDVYDYLSLSQGEVGLSRNYLPRVYLALQYSQDNVGGYVRAYLGGLNETGDGLTGSLSITMGGQALSGYLRVANKLENAQAIAASGQSDMIDYYDTGSLSFPTSWEGVLASAASPLYSSSGDPAQLYVPALQTQLGGELCYSVGSLLEISVDPFQFYSALLSISASNPLAVSEIEISFSFSVYLTYSNAPFESSPGVEYPIISLGEGS